MKTVTQKATGGDKSGKYSTKGDSITVRLTAENARKLQELCALIHHGDPEEFVNLLMADQLDICCDASSGFLFSIVDGWKYDTAAETLEVVTGLNAWLATAGCVGGGHLPLRTKGNVIVTPTHKEVMAASRKHTLALLADEKAAKGV
jgi:hypothetical protein